MNQSTLQVVSESRFTQHSEEAEMRNEGERERKKKVKSRSMVDHMLLQTRGASRGSRLDELNMLVVL